MPGPDPDPETVSFGFEEIPREEKSRRVRGVFARVASRYDLMNDLMSAGLHRAWKDALADRANPQPGERIIDVAGGTGDVARRLKARANRAAARRGRDSATVIVTDVNAAMLAEGIRRGPDGLLWACADAERLPFPSRFADLITVSFGIRNMTDIPAALAEARRVLKPGGRFLCLEFSRLAVVGLDGLYDAYSLQVIPAIGKLVAQDEASYRYLAESIRRFPDQERFAAMIAQAGFSRVDFTNMAGGIAALHIGWAL